MALFWEIVGPLGRGIYLEEVSPVGLLGCNLTLVPAQTLGFLPDATL